MPFWFTLSKAALKSICTILAFCPCSNALWSAWDKHKKCITGTQTFPISLLGGWKHTTALHKLSKMNPHQMFRHLRQYWCYGHWFIIGNRGWQWTFHNWGDIRLFPASRKISITNNPLKHHLYCGTLVFGLMGISCSIPALHCQCFLIMMIIIWNNIQQCGWAAWPIHWKHYTKALPVKSNLII